MRCKNCGWPNKPNETTCVKCHASLISDDDADMVYDNVSDTRSGENLKETVREDAVFGVQSAFRSLDSEKSASIEPEEATKPCPKCGYPLRPGTEKCPNCKFQISGASHSAYSSEPEPKKTGKEARRPTRLNSDNSNLRGTINPYMMSMDLEPSFVLKPIKRANERHELDELEFEGKSVLLNRDNTEANNASITSREQATITNEEGHWYIEDKSQLKTTFVQAANRIELHDGDIILLGNRLFEFHE